MTSGKATEPSCADCGARPAIIILDSTPLCDRCHDARISEQTGWPRLPEPPPPETIAGPDGQRHHIAYRVWRSPGGIAVEASEGERSFEGYHAQVVGEHESDVATLVEQVKAAIRERVARQDLKLSPSGYMIMAGNELLGRFVWRDDGMPYGVVVDGREVSWEEFGRAMEPFEGWEFRISIDGLADDDETEPITEDASPFAFLPVPDDRTH